MPEFRPLLLSRSELSINSDPFESAEASFGDAIRQKTAEGTYRHGVYAAAELLLRESAVAIQYVDVADTSTWHTRSGLQLGFNDHGGGSESGFKLLLNRFTDEEAAAQYVLYSPPAADNTASNTVFHRAAFSFLEWEPHGLEYPSRVPNPLKTAGACQIRRRSDYDFYLVGGSSVPCQLGAAMEAAGFSFDTTPYDEATLHALRTDADTARGRLSYREFHNWPGQQFAAQIALLQAAEKLEK